MKTNRLIAILLTVSIIFSIFTTTAITASAEETTKAPIVSKSFDGFVATQLYLRGMNAAGTILLAVGDASDNETFDSMTTFVAKWVFGTNDSSESFQAILNACNDILESVNNLQKVSENIESLENANAIKNAAEDYSTAWNNHVVDVINAGNSSQSLQNVYKTYEEYIEYATGYKTIPKTKTLSDYENAFKRSLTNLCAANCNKQFSDTDPEREVYYRDVMFRTDVIDTIIVSKIESLLNNMDYTSNGSRFIDKAALYAYYAYPFSAEQAEFIDTAAQQQINKITTMFMLYHDFLAMRAEYYKELKSNEVDGYKTEEECNKKFTTYKNMYDDTFEYFEEKVTEFFESELYLYDGYTKAHTTFDKYLREDSASTENNNNQSFTLRCNTNYNSKITQTPKFYKNASVGISNGKLVFTPFYVLNGNALSSQTTNVGVFNTVTETKGGGFMTPAYVITKYDLTNDYNCLKNGVYSDGNNQYSIVKDTKKLKSLINPTVYSAYKYTPYTYFGQYLDYAKSNPVYLLLNESVSRCDGTYLKYSTVPFYNMKNSTNYNNEWKTENVTQPQILGHSKKNVQYAAILTPNSNTVKTTVDTKILGQGSVTINDVSTATLESGSTATLEIEVPKNYTITSIKALYHGDITNPEKVTSEKVLSNGSNISELELSVGIPYTNVTFEVQTEVI